MVRDGDNATYTKITKAIAKDVTKADISKLIKEHGRELYVAREWAINALP